MLKPALEDELVDRALGEPEDLTDDLVDAEPPPLPYDWEEDFWLKRPFFSEEYAADVFDRFSRHLDEWNDGSVGGTVWNAYRAYHNISTVDDDPITQLQATGEMGELLAMAIPHYRALVRHQIALFTSERPAWDPQARSAESASARQVPLARNLLDYIAAIGPLDARLAEQVELMMIAGAGFYLVGWDSNVGLNGRGWFTNKVFAPWEIAHEKVRTYDDANWWIARVFESRWDWVARFAKDDPDKAEEIAELDTDQADFSTAFRSYEGSAVHEDKDRIAVLYVIARPTLACPEGRFSIVARDDLVLYDGPYPYGEDVTLSRMCASEFLGTSVPYCDSWGVLGPAEAYNAILSMMLTRVDTSGVPNFAVTDGSEIEFSDIAGGNAVWKLPPGSQLPTVVDLLQIPDVMPAIMQIIGSEMEKVVGINSVTRGQPQENVSSGSMAALLQSMAIQFNSNLERAWILNLERIGTYHLRVFQQMATEEHAISVMGTDNRWTVQSFRGEDVKGVLRTTVKTAGALSKTTAGRAEIADKLLERQAINAQEYMRIISTGQLEPTFAGPVGELTGIKARSEKLMRGEKAPPLAWDNHQLCIREFRALLNTEARDDAKIAEGVIGTLREHLNLWAKITMETPDMLAAIGIPPLPQAAQMGAQAQAMKQGAMNGMPPGMPPPGPPPEGPRPMKQPETEAPPKQGPTPKPPGHEPSGAHPAMPKEPKPAKSPLTGKDVV